MKFRSGFVQITVLLTLLVTLAVTAPARAAGTCFVDDSATGANDGTDWANAYTSLQSALADTCSEIWVAAGTYKPDASDRTVSFILENNTAIYGGFNGTETLLNQRDWETNVTILSGDLNGDDSGLTNNSENSYHVVSAASVNAAAVLDGFTISGGNADGGGADDSGGGMLNVNSSSPTLENLIFTGNSANQSGGGMANENSSNPALTNVTFLSNNSDNGGGLSVTISGAPTLTDVSFTGNSASSFGGGMYVNGTAPVLMNVTFANNTAVNGGGGIYNSQGDPALTNVTFSGNNGGASGAGGGIYSNNAGAAPTLTNVTFSANTASLGGGIFNNNSSSLKMYNVIIANSTSGGDCVNGSGTVDGNSSHNLIEDGSNACGLTNGMNGHIVGTDPKLGSLADNGGATQTFALLPGSIAVDQGRNDICPATDQRGVTRDSNCDIGSFEYDYSGIYYVKPSGSGTQDCQSWANACQLQNALNTVRSGDQVWVAAGIYKPDTSDRTKSFMLKDNIAIYGGFYGTETMLSERNPVANVTILSGDLSGNDSGTNDGLNATFNENSYHVVLATGGLSINAVLDGFTITGGHANNLSGDPTHYENGGGMYNNDSSATLTNLIFSNNYALGGGGGLNIYYSNGTSILTNVTFNGNFAGTGGGLYNNTNSSTLTNVTFINNHSYSNGGGMYNFWLAPVLTNVTFSGNSADANGGGLYNMSNNGNDPTLMNVTFSGNTASSGGGLYNNTTFSGTARLNNVIIANSTGGDCVLASGSLAGASSNNLIEDTGSNACGLTNGGNDNIIGSDPNLGPLVGSPAFFPLNIGSPAIDAGTNTGCPATDQRGAIRPQDGACEIGAVESLVVSNTNDSGTGSLRQAIADAHAETIIFDPSLSGQTITLTSGTLLIFKNMTIDGSALASKITISGNNNGRVLAVGGGVTATLNSLIVTAGWFNADGGAGLVNNGTLTITNSIFSYHTADNQFGGAILNNSTGNLTVIGSTFSNNSAFGGGAIANYNQLTVKNSTFINNGGGSTDSGGAIYTDGDPGVPLTQITNSTFSGNTANVGGALWSSRTQTITNSTFSGNVANLNSNSGGALWQDAETLNYANNIMSNSTSSDCSSQSTIGININNLVEDGSCAASLSGDPQLDTLANNGGPTQTFALLPGSKAINTGDDDICDDNPGPNNLDQRGIARPNGDHCDLGAYEHVDTGAPSVTAFNATDATSLNVPIASFTASDDGIITGYLITESATPPLIGNPNWLTTAPVTYTVGSTGSHTLYPWARDGAGNVSAVYGSPDTVNVCFPAITVTNTNDSGAGSLRQAIADACDDSATITFAAGLSGTTINLQSSLSINNPAASNKYLIIDGSSLASQITLSGDSDNDGDGDMRVIDVANNVNSALLSITLDSLKITKGQVTGDGGAILNWAYLIITNSTFSNNSATGYGGAISNNRPLIVTNSTFSDNSSASSTDGGGAIITSSPMTISGSTFFNNTAHSSGGSGGAIWNASIGSTITNSTFSGNSAGLAGAIITTTGSLTITNSTISGNSAVLTGGLVIDGGTADLVNTIIANNSASYGPSNDDCENGATIGTNTNNLIEDGSCSPALTGDPLLGALASNGGPTQTFALLAGSRAINAGKNSTCAAAPINNVDQRGMNRSNSGPNCDIGAYEYQDSTAPSMTAFAATSPSTSLNIPITSFTGSDNIAVAGYKITTSATAPLAGDSGWTASAPTIYTVGSDGAYTLYPWVKDAAGNVSSVSGSPASVMVDTIIPTVLSSVRVNPNPTNKINVQFTVTFSESVTGVDVTDFSLTKTGVTGGSINNVSGSGASYTVSVNTGSGNGTIRLDVKSSGTNIQDAGGNALSGGFTTGQSYTVNKTLTFTSTGSQDGWVLETSELSGLGGTLNSSTTTFNLGDDAMKKQYRGVLSFTTSSIPDNAVITGVTLKVKKQGVTGGGNPLTIFQGFFADVKLGFFGASALQTSDFQTAASKTVGPTSPALTSGWYNLNLITAKAFINKLTSNAGLTQIRLRFKLDDNNNAVANYLSLYSGNAAAGSRPQLVISYYVP